MTTTPNGVLVHHADHGLTDEHLAFIDHVLSKSYPGFFIEVYELPEDCSDLLCALYGPRVGDEPISDEEVSYEVRGERPGPSRLVERPHRPCRRMVICGVAGDEAVIYTAYGTQASQPSPREWWDSSMKPHEAIEAATFWSTHALAR